MKLEKLELEDEKMLDQIISKKITDDDDYHKIDYKKYTLSTLEVAVLKRMKNKDVQTFFDDSFEKLIFYMFSNFSQKELLSKIFSYLSKLKFEILDIERKESKNIEQYFVFLINQFIKILSCNIELEKYIDPYINFDTCSKYQNIENPSIKHYIDIMCLIFEFLIDNKDMPLFEKENINSFIKILFDDDYPIIHKYATNSLIKVLKQKNLINSNVEHVINHIEKELASYDDVSNYSSDSD